jgi:arsenate reductase
VPPGARGGSDTGGADLRGDNCPWSPNTEFRDWSLDDPKGQDDTTVRRIISDIDTRVRDVLVDLVPTIDLPPSVLKDR